jgi:hypothetical protein
MGGYAHWNVLRDDTSQTICPRRSANPGGHLGLACGGGRHVFRGWNPLLWRIIKRGDVFAVGPFEQGRLGPGKRSLLREMLSMLHN